MAPTKSLCNTCARRDVCRVEPLNVVTHCTQYEQLVDLEGGQDESD